jgi:hypothetical protein
LKGVREKEKNKEGVQSQEHRHIEMDELVHLLQIIRSNRFDDEEKVNLDLAKKYSIGSVLTMQWQLIARTDTVYDVNMENIQPHPAHQGTLQIELSWHSNKRMHQELAPPKQIILGSHNPFMCPLLNLAAYVEALGLDTATDFVPSLDGVCYICTERMMWVTLKEVVKSEAFTGNDQAAASATEGLDTGAVKLGSHSIRKGALLYGGRCGLPKDFTNQRGRIAGNTRHLVAKALEVGGRGCDRSHFGVPGCSCSLRLDGSRQSLSVCCEGRVQ